MNVALVTVDSLRADRIESRVMPKTRAFADDAVEFTECVANGPSTPASFPAIHASRYFASVDGLGIPPADAGGPIRTLAEVLSEAGYATAGYTDNQFASGAYHYDRGFDAMHDASSDGANVNEFKQLVQSNLDKDGVVFRTIERVYNRVDALFATTGGRDFEHERADSLNERALDFVDERDDDVDWFTWLHYMDAHHPYEAPAEYQREFLDEPLDVAECRGLSRKGTHHPEEVTDDEWDRIRGLYDAECRYVDDQFRALLDALDDRGVLDDTIVVFTADHGELVGEHGHAGHPPEFWEGVVRVPFIIHHPDLGAATVDGQIRLVDTAPTVADAVDLDAPDDWEGASAFDLLDGDVDAREWAFGDVGRDVDYGRCCARRADGWKLLRHADDGEFCFDVAATPAERPEDDRTDAPEYDELASALDDHQTRMQRMRAGERSGVSEDDEMVTEHLEDLGYLE
ncbi:sulfatase-like hydrolase/transferase [Halorubellus sp. PRR65]|uniref:sulfatase-like hydrolase/transferase n=1 Tax=Halorubellus sp. PRR65 TaxID=3098148 RepID=UPI002B2590B8|nr:sulfatase-like hydrolase/transferase [Halorubellus sp. PRR65]